MPAPRWEGHHPRRLPEAVESAHRFSLPVECENRDSLRATASSSACLLIPLTPDTLAAHSAGAPVGSPRNRTASLRCIPGPIRSPPDGPWPWAPARDRTDCWAEPGRRMAAVPPAHVQSAVEFHHPAESGKQHGLGRSLTPATRARTFPRLTSSTRWIPLSSAWATPLNATVPNPFFGIIDPAVSSGRRRCNPATC